RWLVLGICCMSLLIVSIDNTIVNVALPTIRRDLDASVSELQWTIDAYTLVLASLLIFSGSTADRLGRARIFKVGLAPFTAGALRAGVARAARPPSRPGRPAARAGGPGLPDLRDHRGPGRRLDVAADARPVRGQRPRARAPADLRAPPAGAADRAAVLPQPAV